MDNNFDNKDNKFKEPTKKDLLNIIKDTEGKEDIQSVDLRCFALFGLSKYKDLIKYLNDPKINDLMYKSRPDLLIIYHCDSYMKLKDYAGGLKTALIYKDKAYVSQKIEEIIKMFIDSFNKNIEFKNRSVKLDIKKVLKEDDVNFLLWIFDKLPSKKLISYLPEFKEYLIDKDKNDFVKSFICFMIAGLNINEDVEIYKNNHKFTFNSKKLWSLEDDKEIKYCFNLINKLTKDVSVARCACQLLDFVSIYTYPETILIKKKLIPYVIVAFIEYASDSFKANLNIENMCSELNIDITSYNKIKKDVFKLIKEAEESESKIKKNKIEKEIVIDTEIKQTDPKDLN